MNHQDQIGDSPLIDAVRRGNHETIQHLLNLGADVNIQSNDGKTALYWAITKQDAVSVKILLEANADLSITGDTNTSPNDLFDTIADFEVGRAYAQFKIEQPIKELNNKLSSELDGRLPERIKSKI